MSFVVAVPDVVATAAESVAGIGSSLSAVNAAVAVPTTGCWPPPRAPLPPERPERVATAAPAAMGESARR